MLVKREMDSRRPFITARPERCRTLDCTNFAVGKSTIPIGNDQVVQHHRTRDADLGLCHACLQKFRAKPKPPRVPPAQTISVSTIISQLIDIHPEWATQGDNLGALHAVLNQKVIDEDLLRFLIGKSTKGKALCRPRLPGVNLLPLNFAISRKAPVSVVRILLETFPQAAASISR